MTADESSAGAAPVPATCLYCPKIVRIPIVLTELTYKMTEENLNNKTTDTV